MKTILIIIGMLFAMFCVYMSIVKGEKEIKRLKKERDKLGSDLLKNQKDINSNSKKGDEKRWME